MPHDREHANVLVDVLQLFVGQSSLGNGLDCHFVLGFLVFASDNDRIQLSTLAGVAQINACGLLGQQLFLDWLGNDEGCPPDHALPQYLFFQIEVVVVHCVVVASCCLEQFLPFLLVLGAVKIKDKRVQAVILLGFQVFGINYASNRQLNWVHNKLATLACNLDRPHRLGEHIRHERDDFEHLLRVPIWVNVKLMVLNRHHSLLVVADCRLAQVPLLFCDRIVSDWNVESVADFGLH